MTHTSTTDDAASFPRIRLGSEQGWSGERVPVVVFAEPDDAARAIALEIASLIRLKASRGERCVLGLATGATPIGVYEELVRMHTDEGLSFSAVTTFNLDEYWPMAPDRLQSYHRFMREILFDRVDIDLRETHIPDGAVPWESVKQMCADYERMIVEAGGIDLQLLGIGRTGHIGFNEPGSGRACRTRGITLDRVTRRDAASDFFGEEHVPARAVTMGVGTILEARRILLMAIGEGKAPTVHRFVEGEPSDTIPATHLQSHPRTTVVLDRAAAAQLRREQCPWLVRHVTWNDAMTRKAVTWLAQRCGKAILKLVNEDYNEQGLQDLLASKGSAYDINLAVYQQLRQTITGWPGGKPEEQRRPGDIPRRSDAVFPKRVVVFSPHPDDDVISMGGTISRLAEQGHELHVAYQTSGNIAVFDADSLRFLDFAADFNTEFALDAAGADRLERRLAEMLRTKKPGEVDPPEVQRLKGLIRRGEAKAACAECGVREDRLHFLDLPFYETGKVRKRPLGADDVAIIVALLREVRPHQIYAAGDLSDPHGTHRVCLKGILAALQVCAGDQWARECETWLYRGAWQEWPVHEIEMAVPLSPGEVKRKRTAIFRHQSQKDRALFPGADTREFWQRAEDRNAATAKTYDQLGLPEFEAIEAFVTLSTPSAAPAAAPAAAPTHADVPPG